MTHRDLHSGNHLEDALHDEALRATLDATADGILVVDEKGKVLFANRRFSRMWRIPPDLLDAGDDAELLRFVLDQLEDPETFLARVRELYKSLRDDFDVLRFRDGRAFERHSCPLVQDDRILGRVWSFRDITKRVKTEEAMKGEIAFREAVINRTTEGLCVCHEIPEYPYVAFTVWNEQMTQITGYTLEEINRLGWYQSMFPDPDEQTRAVQRLKEILEGNDLRSEEWTVTLADGRQRVLAISTSAIHASNTTHILALMRDVTESKQAEEKRRQLAAQIQQTQKLESLGILAGGIAHEFNNLLAGILGNADLARHKLPADSPVREYLETIESVTRRAADLTIQMLAYSGRGAFVVRPVALSKLIDQMRGLIEATVSKKATLHYDFAADLPLIRGDAAQLQQVIMNLVTNASDALEGEAGAVTVGTDMMEVTGAYLRQTYLKDDLTEGPYVCLEVSDTGKGMDSDTQARLFDPFFSTKFQGRGLGLAAVLGIVRGHEGAVHVYSEVGRGTRFRVLLPAIQDTESPLHEHITAAEDKAIAAWRCTGTILIADDEQSILNMAREICESCGLAVLTASDGREAVEVFRARTDDITVVLLDLTMPELSGDEAFREIAGINPSVPIILSSGYTEQDVTNRLPGRGPSAFIQKPFVASDLLGTLRDVLEGNSPAAPGTDAPPP